MSRMIPSIAFALVTTALAAHAQETTVKSKTKSSGGEAKTVTYIGCVKGGGQSQGFVLDQVVPVSRTTTTEVATGASSTSTTYMLVPGGSVEVKGHLGKKVQVTGTLIPGGDITTETTTKIDREDAKDTKIKEKTETKNSMPQFHVTSIKDLGESCQ